MNEHPGTNSPSVLRVSVISCATPEFYTTHPSLTSKHCSFVVALMAFIKEVVRQCSLALTWNAIVPLGRLRSSSMTSSAVTGRDPPAVLAVAGRAPAAPGADPVGRCNWAAATAGDPVPVGDPPAAGLAAPLAAGGPAACGGGGVAVRARFKFWATAFSKWQEKKGKKGRRDATGGERGQPSD